MFPSDYFTKAMQTMLGSIFVGTMLALVKAISLWKARDAAGIVVTSPSKGTKEQTLLTNRQLGLLGIRSKVEKAVIEPLKTPSKTKLSSSPSEDVLHSISQSLVPTVHLNSAAASQTPLVGAPRPDHQVLHPLYILYMQLVHNYLLPRLLQVLINWLPPLGRASELPLVKG